MQVFSDFNAFEAAAREKGVNVDLRTLLTLHVAFYEQYEDYVIITAKGYDENPEAATSILVLSKDNSLVYTKYPFGENDYKLFRHTMQKEYGESTVLTLLTLKYTLSSYQKRFDGINKYIDEFDEAKNPDVEGLEQTSKHLRRLTDRVEDLIDLTIWLEDRKIRQMNTSYVSYDYDVLSAKAKYLLDRCHNHRQEIQNIRNDLEVKNTRELNKRIEYLSDVVKRLTAITILLMIPNIVAGHFGMNFTNTIIPWSNPWGETFVILFSALLVGATYWYLKKRDWF